MLRIKRQAIALAVLGFGSSLAFAVATVSGNLQDAGGTAVSSRTFVRFWLRGCANNQPRVNGVALIVPPGGPGYYKDFTPDTGGAIAGNIYRNSEIECNGATGNTWYGVQVYRDGKPGPETPYSIITASFNLNTATPTVQTPPPPPATFPYIMANPLAAQTIAGFPLIFGSGSGIGANYGGSSQPAGRYLRSDGSLFQPVTSASIVSDLGSSVLVTSPSALQTINSFPVAFGAGSGLSASYQGGLVAAGRYLKSNGTNFIASSLAAAGVGNCSVAGQFVSTLNGDAAPTCSGPVGGGANGVVYNTGTAFASTAPGGAGTLCLVSTNGGVPAFSSCSGGSSTAWSALTTPSADLSLNMGQRVTSLSWGTGTGLSSLFTIDGSTGNGSGSALVVRGQGGFAPILRVDNLTTPIFEVTPTSLIGTFYAPATTIALNSLTGGFANSAFYFQSSNAPFLSGARGDDLALVAGAGDGTASGGNTIVKGGNGAFPGNTNGGDVLLLGGLRSGAGVSGKVQVADIDDLSKIAQFLPEALPTGTVAIVGLALTTNANLDFDLTGAGITCQDLPITVPELPNGDAVSIGVFNSLASASGVELTAWVSSANTVTVRACDVTSSNPNPAAAPVRAVVWKF